MKLSEDFIKRGHKPLLSDWGHGELILKYKYKNEHASEVKTYKMSKKELEHYQNGQENKKHIQFGGDYYKRQSKIRKHKNTAKLFNRYL